MHIAAAAEALAFAEAMGLDAGAVRDVIRDGAAASFMLDDRGERMVDGAFDEAKSALDIFVKDMGLVTDAARSVDLCDSARRGGRSVVRRGFEGRARPPGRLVGDRGGSG